MPERWELTPEQTPAFGPIAERFRRAGDLDRAVELCREGLAKFPNHLSGRVTLGWALLDLGRYDEARAELERVIKRAPDNLAAIRGLAELHDRAENAVFVPADAHLAWPPKPDAIEAAGNGWIKEGESAAEQLPSILAELAPMLPAVEAAKEGDGIPAVSLGDLEIRPEAVAEPEPVMAAAAAPSLEDAVAELESAIAPEPAAPREQADAAAAVTSTALAKSEASGEVTEPVVEAAQIAEPEPAPEVLIEAAAIAEPEPLPEPVAEITPGPLPEPIELTTPLVPELTAEPLPEPVVDLMGDMDVDVAAALQSEFEAPRLAQELEPVLELTLDTGGDPLLEAVEAVEMSLDAPEPAAPLAVGMTSDLAVQLDAAVPVAADPIIDSVEVTLDPALFELADAASDESALPRMDVLRDEVFELDQESAIDVAALLEPAPTATDFHAPEPATVTPAAMDDGGRERRRAMYDLQLEAPALAPAAELPAHDFHEIDGPAPAASARDAHAESAMQVSQDFASVMEAQRDFTSPQVSTFEHADPDPAPLPEPVVEVEPAATLPEPAVEVEPAATLPEPATAFVEPTPEIAVADAVADAGATPSEPAPVAAQPVGPAPPPPPKPKKKKKPVAGLQRFLRNIEDRKAKLARNSAA